MAKRESLEYPSLCPHCRKSIASLRPVGELALQAAIAICRGSATSRDVAQVMEVTVQAAGMYLKRAEKARLVSKAFDERAHARGGRLIHYKPSQRIEVFAPISWRLYERSQHQKGA